MKLSTCGTFKNLNTNAKGYAHLEGDLLRKYQGYLLKMAKDIIDVCEQEDICYHLGGGTALGAVRSGGFIPWDDDVDINILGDDFNRFCDCFRAQYGDRYFICDANTPRYSKPMARVCLRNSVYCDYDEGDSDNCFFIDLFRLENIPDRAAIRILHGIICLTVGFCLSCRIFFKYRKSRIRIARENPKIARVFYLKIAIGALLSFLSAHTWARLTWKCYALCKNSNSKYVGFPSGRKHYFGEIHLREEMVDTIEMPFEGHRWRVPKGYDAYLRALYGPDYMTPPPEDQREHHVYFELKFPDEN